MTSVGCCTFGLSSSRVVDPVPSAGCDPEVRRSASARTEHQSLVVGCPCGDDIARGVQRPSSHDPARQIPDPQIQLLIGAPDHHSRAVRRQSLSTDRRAGASIGVSRPCRSTHTREREVSSARNPVGKRASHRKRRRTHSLDDVNPTGVRTGTWSTNHDPPLEVEGDCSKRAARPVNQVAGRHIVGVTPLV